MEEATSQSKPLALTNQTRDSMRLAEAWGGFDEGSGSEVVREDPTVKEDFLEDLPVDLGSPGTTHFWPPRRD